MHEKSTIEKAISAGRHDEAVEMLDRNIVEDPANDCWWYLRAKAYWGLGQRAKSITDYEEAAHLNPASPATHALQMVRDIMDFYNPDLLNP